jgi:hypothetical protein
VTGCNRYRRTGSGVKTQAEADALIAETTLPEGWRITAAPIRSFETRSEWMVLLWQDDRFDKGWRVYDFRGVLRHVVAHAERAGTVVTADRDGWVKSWEDAS